jgi:hypothetical protein
LHLPSPLIDVFALIDFGFAFVVLIVVFDTFLIPWLSRKALGLQILRLYPASRWAIRLSVLLLLTPTERHKIRFPKCTFWEVHTSYKTRKPSKKLTFTRLLLRDIQTLDSSFRKFSCFYGHTPMPIDKLITLSKSRSIVSLQGPFLSKTPEKRTLIVDNKPAPWYVYLISIMKHSSS